MILLLGFLQAAVATAHHRVTRSTAAVTIKKFTSSLLPYRGISTTANSAN